jgi:hypothetical protein
VEKDHQVLGMRRWRELVIDRRKWRAIFRLDQSPQRAVWVMEEEAIKHVTGRIFSTIGERRYAYRILVARPEERRPLGRPMHRWVNDTKMDLQEVGYEMDRSG